MVNPQPRPTYSVLGFGSKGSSLLVALSKSAGFFCLVGDGIYIGFSKYSVLSVMLSSSTRLPRCLCRA